jgi:hypothetical protein
LTLIIGLANGLDVGPVKRKDEKGRWFFDDIWLEGEVWPFETSDFRGSRRFADAFAGRYPTMRIASLRFTGS